MARLRRGRRPDPALNPPPEVAAKIIEETRPDEDEVQRGFVFQLLMRALPKTTIYAACRAQYGVGTKRTDDLILQVKQGLRSDAETNRPFARPEQVARLRELISTLKSPRERDVVRRVYDPKTKRYEERVTKIPLPIPAAQIVRAEELLAEVEGNKEPTRVEITMNVNANVQAVFVSLTPERAQALLEQARERKRLAAAAKETH